MPKIVKRASNSTTPFPHTERRDIEEITYKLLKYCRDRDWAGYDPYDALNSRLFKALPFLNFKLARLVLTQGVKRSPINLRPILLVPKTTSPKGVALFLSAIIKLLRIGLIDDENMVVRLADKLMIMRSPWQKYWCWGYNFDWQTRGELVPKGLPNIICTTFAANALLDAYEYSNEPMWLAAATSAAEYILDVLFWRENDSKACFSYTPLGRSEIHNANLLGAALLCRVGNITGQNRFLEPALDAARFSVSKQRPDGSWPYGEGPHQAWIDNFHTGYNLMALGRIAKEAGTMEFESSIRKGFKFYLDNFFRNDGAPKYYHDRVYPIDIHSVAQSVLTLLAFEDEVAGNRELVLRILDWALAEMRDKHGYFYFQKHLLWTARTPFMRWSQAWMLLALATFLEKELRTP